MLAVDATQCVVIEIAHQPSQVCARSGLFGVRGFEDGAGSLEDWDVPLVGVRW